MNIENRFQQIKQADFSSPDRDVFIAKLHGERQRRYQKKVGFMNGVAATALVAVFGMASFSQLTDDPTVYRSTDLYAMEVMDSETEAYVYELADYLVSTSDDIWETMAFLDDIQFEPVVAMSNGGTP